MSERMKAQGPIEAGADWQRLKKIVGQACEQLNEAEEHTTGWEFDEMAATLKAAFELFESALRKQEAQGAVTPAGIAHDGRRCMFCNDDVDAEIPQEIRSAYVQVGTPVGMQTTLGRVFLHLGCIDGFTRSLEEGKRMWELSQRRLEMTHRLARISTLLDRLGDGVLEDCDDGDELLDRWTELTQWLDRQYAREMGQ